MSITALEIQQVSFGTAKKGYDPAEVDEFLERVAIDVDTLNRAIAEAATRIRAAEERAATAEAQVARARSAASAAQSAAAPATQLEPVKAVAPAEPSVSEDVISKAFIAAQRSADAMQDEARRKAESVYREAEAKARDIVREAHAEKQKTMGELDRLRESTERFRTDYLSLLSHYSVDAQKRFPAFEEVIPSSPTADYQKQKDLIAANSATVAPASAPATSAAKPESRSESASAATPALDFAAPPRSELAPTYASEPDHESVAATGVAKAKPSYAGFDSDDDEELDIEEID
ncbi:MAG: DivIVA domain-containing protein [Coriobacteriales bacterium]|jgi:cell division initiation protein|nr:DivIVA domain-containing protein [Coriobacteriales bacterium]